MTTIPKSKQIMISSSVYHGIRGKLLHDFVFKLLALGKLKAPYREVILKNGIDLYENVFTHSSANSIDNYEYLEFLGDVTLNKSIAWYLSRRFPELNCPDGVRVLTRLKINLISKKSFAELGKELGFWEFVSCDEYTRENKMAKTLEDVFEAFFGATELLIDTYIKQGAGYAVCYNIVEYLLDQKDISLKYNHLFDAKTRLKEIFDYFGSKLGELKYTSEKKDRIHYVTANQIINNTDIVLGKGYAYLKVDAQQKAAEDSIQKLKELGFERPLPDYYARFCK